MDLSSLTALWRKQEAPVPELPTAAAASDNASDIVQEAEVLHTSSAETNTTEAKETLDESILMTDERMPSVQETLLSSSDYNRNDDAAAAAGQAQMENGSKDDDDDGECQENYVETNGSNKTTPENETSCETPSSLLPGSNDASVGGGANSVEHEPPPQSSTTTTSTAPPTGRLPMAPLTASETEQEINKTNHKNTRTTRSGKKSWSGTQSERGHRNGHRVVVDRSASATPRGINEAAALLAKVDDEAYQRAILQDASCILERIVFPMCFPWNHSIVFSNRNFPKDIDDLPAILQADNEEYTPFDNGVLGYGGFEVGKDRRPTNGAIARGRGFLAGTRRTDDVGVIELTVLDNDSSIDKSSLLRKRKRREEYGARSDMTSTATDKEAPKASWRPNAANACKSNKNLTSTPDSKQCPSQNRDGDDETELESLPATSHDTANVATERVVLPAFEHARAAKKQKLLASKETAHRLFVSVRLGSVSSRSSILGGKNTTTPHPLLLEGTLPSRRNRSNDGGGELNADRAKWLRRDNLSWTHASVGGYQSKLSYTTLPSHVSKKPRDVHVGVRLNGRLLPRSQSVSDSVLAVLGGGAIINRPVEPSMCMLDCDRLMDTSVRRSIVRANTPWKSPRLDCIPPVLCGGFVQVVCTSPGTLKPMNVQDLLRFSEPRCTICWTDEGDVMQCCKCGVQVHPACCANGGVHVPSDNGGRDEMSWMCAVCSIAPKQQKSSTMTSPPTPRRRPTNLPSRYQSQSNVLLGIDLHDLHAPRDVGSSTVVCDSLKCSLCPHWGGAMSTWGGTVWCHEVCRIWTRSSSVVQQHQDLSRRKISAHCALCGSDGGALVSCAASGCTVQFHPMCARLACAEDDNRNGDLSSPPLSSPCDDSRSSTTTRLERDKRLCRRFTLDLVECNGSDGGGGQVLPVGFCGLHNPKRDRFLYGCYPGGMKSAMRVPPYKRPKMTRGQQQQEEVDDSDACTRVDIESESK